MDHATLIRLRRVTSALLPAPRLNVRSDEGSGPVIIMLHGIASSSSQWEYLRPLLTPHFRCVAIDLLGFGASPKPPWSAYTIDDHVRSLRATIRGLKLRGGLNRGGLSRGRNPQDSVILMGHSLGSLIATRYAAKYPRDVRRLVLLSPPVYLPASQLATSAARGLTNMYMAAYRYLREHKDFTLGNVDVITKTLRLGGAFELTEDTWEPFVRSLEQCIESQTLITDITRVQAPVDVFYGGLDQLLIRDNLQVIGAIRGVTLHSILTADHIVRKGYAAAVAKELLKIPK